METISDEELRFQCVIAARDSFQPGAPAKQIMQRATTYFKFVRPQKKQKNKQVIGFKK